MFKRIVMICGVPRSGTSWVGQILDSSPETVYRFQPLFSWAFKNYIGPNSSKKKCDSFFTKVYNSQNPFLLQAERKKEGIYPVFGHKDPLSPVLVIKMVRYHHLLPMLLDYFENTLQVAFIIRHPCGVINSWLKTPKEFFKDADPQVEWDLAESRNKDKPEEYWGFDGWKRFLDIYSTIKEQFPQNVFLINYEQLVINTMDQVTDLFSFLNIEISLQTKQFLLESTQINNSDPYSVYKNKKVKDNWKIELDPAIKDAVLNKLKQLPYNHFFD